MPYDTTTENLENLVDRVLHEEDFAKKAEEAGVSPRKLVKDLSDLPEIWSGGEKERVKLERLEAEYTARLDLEFTLRRERQRRRIERSRLLILIAMGSLLINYLFLRYSNDPPPALSGLSQLTVPLIALVSVTAVWTYFRIRKGRFETTANSVRAAIAHEDLFEALAEQIVTARGDVDEAVISQGLKTKIREIIDKQLALPFSTHLPELNYSGLSDVFNTANEIATDAKRELEFMLETMPGGSIGIAGPRGSGKSTLLKSACADRAGNLEIRKVIPLFTTAPVEYQGRDFILHLFSAICNKMLQLTTYQKRGVNAIEEITRAQRWRRYTTAQRLAPFALIAGICLVAISILAAVIKMTVQTPEAPQTTNIQIQAPAAGTAPNPQPPAQPHQSPAPRSTRFVEALDLKPGLFLTSGLLLLLVYFIFMPFRRYWFLPDPPADESRRLDLDFKLMGNLEKIRNDAKAWLQEIKFQQSFTSGWSGAIKLPVGLEGGVNTAVSLAQQQLSLPDITQGFSDFVSSIASDFKVIIGIDELDKLDSDDAAQRFLNEIKAVFGLPKVFYLISVSENAMSNFERRGLPFRDVFDSSFDNIIYVEYLKLEQAKRLLARRVAGMPPPFAHLCYCISGGLARDLVRTCRNLAQHAAAAYEVDKDGAAANLKALSSALIESDLRLKLHALVVAAKKLPSENSVSAFVEKLHALENGLNSVPTLLRIYEDLMKQVKPALSNGAATNGAAGLVEVYDTLKQRLSGATPNPSSAAALAALHEELASYLYYCVTLLEFFSDVLNENVFAKAEEEKVFDRLARARQYLAINSAVTRNILDSFRQSYGMKVPDIATVPTVVV